MRKINDVEKIQVLVESANGLIDIYHNNIKNTDFTVELRQIMSSNIITLSTMVEQSFDIFTLNNEKISENNDIINKHFKLFNELVDENMNLVEKFFTPNQENSNNRKPKM